MSTYNICFCGKIRKKYQYFQREKVPYLELRCKRVHLRYGIFKNMQKSQGQDQPAQMCRLIRALAYCKYNLQYMYIEICK